MKRNKGKACLLVLLLLVSLIGQLHPVMAFDEDVAINEANFPDANFRDYIRGFDTNSDGILDTNESFAVTEIRCGALNIVSVKGIEHFHNLDLLECHGNRIESLDVSKNPKLTRLHCHINEITELDLSKNLFLQILYCDKNNLQSLDLSQNSELKIFFGHNNQLTTLDLSSNSKLDDGYSYWDRQICPDTLFGRWENGMFVFDLTDILGNKISRISNVRRSDGSPLPAGAIYDYNTGILQVYEPGRIPDILYDYDVQHTGDRDKPMDVKVSLDYPAQIVVFRAGSKDYYSTGETVALAARAEGGTPPYRYSFVAARSDGTETILRDYAYSNVFNWKPTTPDSYLLTVSVLDANDRWDIRNRYIWVTAGLRIAVFRTGNKTSYSTGETVALAARAEDGATPYRYQFYVVRSNGSKVILRKFASSNVFNWTPTTPDNYRVGVEVKDANGLTVSEEKNVTVTASEPLEVAVFRAGSKTTYAPGESVALAARGEGGTAPYRYQFYVYRSNGARVILKNYSYSNIFTWKPVSLDTYRVCVAIRDARGKVITKALYVTVKKK